MSHTARLILMVGAGVAAAWLLPAVAVPESRVASGSSDSALTTSARVAFKIVIPKTLYMRVGGEPGNALDAGVVGVLSNNHNPTVNAASRTDSIAPARGSVPRRRIYTVSLP